VNYNWNWGIFFQTSPDGVHTYLETLLLGTGWTLATALSAWCLALAMGSLVGVIRTTFRTLPPFLLGRWRLGFEPGFDGGFPTRESISGYDLISC
jgi:ABC-type amino acid transport system permease subunit